MSATLPFLCDLAKWLNAEIYTTDYCPVKLLELVKVENGKILKISTGLELDVPPGLRFTDFETLPPIVLHI